MKKIITAAIAIAAVAGTAGAAEATTGYRVKPIVCRATLVDHPENATPVWAYDTFTRVTTFKRTGASTWSISFYDAGRFTTVKGAKSDSGDTIVARVTGNLRGTGTFGPVESRTAPHCPGHEVWKGTGSPSTSAWAAHYFTGDVSVQLKDWGWTYNTCRERMVETPSGVSGHLKGLPCFHRPPYRHTPAPKPTGKDCTPTPTPTVTSTVPAQTPPVTEPGAPQPITGQPVFTG